MVENAKFNIQQIENIYGRINNFTGNGLNEITSYGDIAWFSEALKTGADIEKISDGNPNGIKNIIDRLINILKKIGTQETSSAREEVTDTAKKAEELNQRSRELGVKMEGDFSEVQASIDEQSEIVTEASGMLTETQETIKTKQEKIQETIAKINEAQTALATETDPTKQAELLNQIQGLAGEITTYTSTIIAQQDTLLDLKGAVDDATANIADATEKMTVIVTDGQAKIGQLAKEATSATGDVAKTASKGAGNTSAAAALKSAATASGAAGIIPVLGAGAAATTAELERAAIDQTGAATVRLGSISTNFSRITTSIGSLENNATILANYNATVGSALAKFTGLVGAWNVQLPAVITSVGSAVTLETENEALKALIPTDLDKINASSRNTPEAESTENTPTTNGAEPSQQETDNSKIELETPKFKFGI